MIIALLLAANLVNASLIYRPVTRWQNETSFIEYSSDTTQIANQSSCWSAFLPELMLQ
jgi:hypothetical protein